MNRMKWTCHQTAPTLTCCMLYWVAGQTAEVEGKLQSTRSLQDTPGPSASSHQESPGPSTSSQLTSPGPSTSSRPTSPGPSTSSQPAIPGPSTSSRPATPGPSTSSQPTSPCPVDDIPVPKKKRKRVTNIQCTEKAATSLVKDVLTVQAKEREKRTQAEKKLSAKEEAREKRVEDREQKFMDSMTSMMSVMSQFVGTMMYGFPSAAPTYSGASTSMNTPLPTSYSMYPHIQGTFCSTSHCSHTRE